MLKSALIGAVALTLAGCATVDVANYRSELPPLDLAQYFNGTVDGWGMFQDRSGKVVRRFTVRIDAKWDGNRGTGTAGDVVGTGQGIQQGNAFNMRYVLRVPWAGRTIDVDMDDWMWRIDDQTVLNRTAMTKFGFRVGEVTLSLRKR